MGLFLFIVAILVTATGGVLFGVALRRKRAYEMRRAEIRQMSPNEQRYTQQPSKPKLVPSIGAAVAAFGLLFFLLSTLTVVGTKNVGIETEFGKVQSTMTPGIHMKAPWANVYDWDGTIQVLKDTNVPVRLENNSTAHVSVRIQWQLDPHADVKALYQNWKSFDKIQDNVIEPQVGRSLNDVFGTYDPLAVDATGKPEVIVTNLADTVKTDMIKDLPNGILVQQVTIIGYTNDNSVQSQINQLVAQAAALKSADLQKQINEATAQANKALQAGGAVNAATLTQNCLNITQQALKAGQPLPAGWNCFGSGNLAVAAK